MPMVFLEELIAACVLAASEAQIISKGNRATVSSLYFSAEAAAQDLQFMDQVAEFLNVDGASCSVQESAGTCSFNASVESTHKPIPTKLEASSTIETFVATANAPSHPIRNQLDRLTAANPNLFAVIQQEGAV